MTTAETHIDMHQPDMDTRAKLGDAILQAAQVRAVTMPEAKALLETAQVPDIVNSTPYDRVIRSRILMGLGSRATQIFRRVDKREVQTGVLLGLTGSATSKILPASREAMEAHSRVKNHAKRSGIPVDEVIDLFAARDVNLLHAARPLPATLEEEAPTTRPYLSKTGMAKLLAENRAYLEPDEVKILEIFIETGTTPKAAKLADMTQKDYKSAIDNIRNKCS